MKAVLFILALFLTLAANGQDYTQKKMAALDAENWFPAYTPKPTDGDTVGAGRDSLRIYFFANKGDANYYDFQLRIAEVSGTANVACSLQGKKFNENSWTNITTTSYKGTGSDTTILYTQTSTKQFYNWYSILLVRTAGKVSVTDWKGALKK